MVSSFNLLKPFCRLQCARGLICLGLLALLTGCDQAKIEVYTVPKEVASPAVAPGNDSAGRGGLEWALPKGWKSLPADGMRVGSFQAVGKDGHNVDISIIPLAGMMAGELENVNRWRNQVGLAPVSEAENAQQVRSADVGEQKGRWFEMRGTNAETKQPMCIVAVILTSKDKTWFFKMTGDNAAVDEQKDAFTQFLKSVVIADAVAMAPSITAAQPPALESAGNVDLPKWEVPAGWQPQGEAPMVLATFKVTGENGASAVVAISRFEGDVGGVLANINRWRTQLGLTEINASQLPAQITSLDLNGAKAILTDMTGKDQRHGGVDARLIAAIVPQGGNTWFYKMTGPPPLIEQQKPAFAKFVQSVHY